MVKEQWNLIVKHYKREGNALEAKIESDWIDMLVEIFGYKKLLGEIDVHRSIQIGSTERATPDVIVRSSDKDLFLIEFKRYTSLFNEKMEAQLKSYLDLLHLSIGIIICQKIYVYSYKDGKLKKCEIEFYENNKNGEEFLELFKRGNFTKEKVEEYVDSYKNVDTEVEEILKELTAPGVKEILKRHFVAKPYSDEAIEKAFEKRTIIVTRNGDLTPPPPPPNPYGKYRFEGREYNKTQLVLAVIKAYVRDNPNVTYKELKDIFPKHIQGSWGVVSTPEAVKLITEDPRKRFHMDNPICLKEGTVIVVCSQWGSGDTTKNNFEKFLAKCDLLGYTVIPV